MKLIIFIIIIGIIYLLATRIKVVHIDSLPTPQQKELNERTRLRNMLLTTYVRCPEKEERIQNMNNKINKIKPNVSHLIKLVRSKLVDQNYNFNFANLPVTSRYPSKDTSRSDGLYTMYIKKDIQSWSNKLFGKNKNSIQVSEIKLVSITETIKEFIIDANIILVYGGEEKFLKLRYYGVIQQSDDPFFGGNDEYYLQLTSVKEITEEEYEARIEASGRGPFVTMSEQMEYVNKIKKMHDNEMDYY